MQPTFRHGGAALACVLLLESASGANNNRLLFAGSAPLLGKAAGARVAPLATSSSAFSQQANWRTTGEFEQARRAGVCMMAKTESRAKASKAKKPAPKARGFGAPVAEPLPPPLQELVRLGKSLARDCAKKSEAANDPTRWVQLASGAAQLEEYAEARVIMEAGIDYLGEEHREVLKSALGQMRRAGPLPETAAAGAAMAWPGKADETPYEPEGMRFTRLSAPAWPADCPRGTHYPSGHNAIAVSETPVLPPSECAWVVDQANAVAQSRWLSDHADASTIGTDMIWAKGFPDRLWLREVRPKP